MKTASKPKAAKPAAAAPNAAKRRAAATATVSAQAAAKPFVFGSEPTPVSTALPALDRMNEKLSRRLRTIVEGMSRNKVKLAAQATTTVRYAQWQDEQPDYLSLSIFSFLSPTTVAMLSIDAALIMRMVDARYGGTGASARGGGHELTPSEEHFAGRLIDAIAGALDDSWNEIVPVSFQLKSRETNQAFAIIAHSDEQVAIVSFDIEIAGVAARPLQLIYPMSSLRQVERELAVGTKDEARDTDFLWRGRLRQALGQVRVSARTVLARPEMKMGDVLRLSVGDIIPVNIPAQVPLFVGNRELALGIVGDHDGTAAIRIERITK